MGEGESEEEKILVKFCPKQVEGWMGGHPDCRDGGRGQGASLGVQSLRCL